MPEGVRSQRLLRLHTELVPARAAVIRQTPRRGLAMAVVVRETVAQRRRVDIGDAAVLRVRLLRLLLHVDDVETLLSHRLQHPYDVVAVRVDGVGEVEAATAALRSGDDEQVR